MMEKQQTELLDENRRLRFRLDRDLQRAFEDEEAYVATCQRQDAVEMLTARRKEGEKLTRHIDRQIDYVEKELGRLSGCLHDLREHVRRDMRRTDTAITEAIAVVRSDGSKTENGK